jgi:hypothetical protein
MQESQFTVKSPEGQSHKVQGDPSVLTLRDVIGEVGKTGASVFHKVDCVSASGARSTGNRISIRA